MTQGLWYTGLMPERDPPNLNRVREAMREHDHLHEAEEAATPPPVAPEAPEDNQGEEQDEDR